MSDAVPDNAPVFAIQRMYLKDMSLELPNAPQIFLEQAAPAVEVQLDVANGDRKSTRLNSSHSSPSRMPSSA